jgi:hypothetical protein
LLTVIEGAIEPNPAVGQADNQRRGRQMTAPHHPLQGFEELGLQSLGPVISSGYNRRDWTLHEQLIGPDERGEAVKSSSGCHF